jgi:hypothetical protein
MKPYHESGQAAQRKLQSKPAADATEKRLLGNLRGYKQVINLMAGFGLVLIPSLGLIMQSALIAACVALNFLMVIIVLELLERRVKSALHEHRQKQSVPEPELPL